MSEPRSAHVITIEPNADHVTVRFNGRTVVDTRRALTLREGAMPPVLYVPREDAAMDLLHRTARATHCPFKGDAAYYSIEVDGQTAESAVWTYEQPFPAVAAIKDHLAFYQDRVEIGQERAA